MSLFIHATNVNYGGGAILLNNLISSTKKDKDIVFHFDSRLKFNKRDVNFYKSFKPSFIARFYAEYILWKSTNKFDKVICFGNLPPIFKLKAHTTLFIQNRFLLDNSYKSRLFTKFSLNLLINKIWLKLFYKNINMVIVQTPTMQKLVKNNLSDKIPIKIVTLADSYFNNKNSSSNAANKVNDHTSFIYVASGALHKNHKNLINAWRMLAQDGIFPTLKLTLNLDRVEDKDVYDWISIQSKINKLKIKNLGNLSFIKLKKEYLKSNALIYPSFTESLGLPLIEARELSIKVIAPELDYVRDILNPDETFDPNSEVSIYRAVKRFLKKETKTVSINSFKDFLNIKR